MAVPRICSRCPWLLRYSQAAASSADFWCRCLRFGRWLDSQRPTARPKSANGSAPAPYAPPAAGADQSPWAWCRFSRRCRWRCSQRNQRSRRQRLRFGAAVLDRFGAEGRWSASLAAPWRRALSCSRPPVRQNSWPGYIRPQWL